MYAGSVNAKIVGYVVSIMNWGIAGAVMVGFPASLIVRDEDRWGGFLTLGFVSFMVIRSLLLWWEYRDAKEGF